MAPEISTGNYHKQIDIYSAGVILYEMLTGHVPFDGESAGEILMKHLTSPPDLSKLPPAYVNIVGKALAKNPAHRYASMLEMAKEVEALGGETAKRRDGESAKGIDAAASPRRPLADSQVPVLTVVPLATPRGQLAELCASLALVPLVAAIFSTLWMSISSVVSAKTNGGNDVASSRLAEIGLDFFLTVAACWAVLIPAKIWNGRQGDTGFRRGVMMVQGVLVGLLALWMGGWVFAGSGEELSSTRDGAVVQLGQSLSSGPVFQDSEDIFMAARLLTYFGLAFFAIRWWRMADRHRAQRFSFGPILSAGICAAVLLLIWPMEQLPPYGAVALVLTAAIVQLVSPWEPRPVPVAKRMRLRYS
jgi:eukaryotic-like serine/threonine-protein kinase